LLVTPSFPFPRSEVFSEAPAIGPPSQPTNNFLQIEIKREQVKPPCPYPSPPRLHVTHSNQLKPVFIPLALHSIFLQQAIPGQQSKQKYDLMLFKEQSNQI